MGYALIDSNIVGNEKRNITIRHMCAYRERLDNGYYKKVFDKIKEKV